MQPVLSIDIFENHSIIKKYNSSQTQVKYVGNEAIKDFFATENVSTPIFPLWTVAYNASGNRIKLLSCVEKGMITINTVNGQYNFYYPYIYFLWVLNKTGKFYNVTTDRIFSSYNFPDEDTPLYKPYLPNVFSGGNICWGSDHDKVHESFDSLHKLKEFQDIWFISIFNNHLVKIESIAKNHNKVFNNFVEWASSGLTLDKPKRISEIMNMEA